MSCLRILIMGLPGSGKTTLAESLQIRLWEEGRTVSWFNADQIRKQYNDWDFSDAGRLRQSRRMKELSHASTNNYVICDFVCPTEELRQEFNADILIWMDTIKSGRFEDTNQLFQQPSNATYRITDWDSRWLDIIIADLT
jgi:adenylylsulfate kinase